MKNQWLIICRTTVIIFLLCYHTSFSNNATGHRRAVIQNAEKPEFRNKPVSDNLHPLISFGKGGWLLIENRWFTPPFTNKDVARIWKITTKQFSQNFNAVQNMGSSEDFDGDGINNYDDYDNDNDGVLDATECKEKAITLRPANQSNGGTSWPGFTSSTITRTFPDNLPADIENNPTPRNRSYSKPGAGNNYSGTFSGPDYGLRQSPDNTSTMTFTFSVPIPADELFVVMGDVDFRTSPSHPHFEITINEAVENATATVNDFDIYQISDNPLPNGPANITNGWDFDFPVGGSGNKSYTVMLRGKTQRTVKRVKVTFRDIQEKAYFGIGAFTPPACDTDNDGVPNVFDLDSDGDLCSDAVEAGVARTSDGPAMEAGTLKNGSNGAITSEDTDSRAVVAGPYGNNGFANSIETGTESGTYNSEYTYSLATNGTRSENCQQASAPLPLKFLEFTVRKGEGSTALLRWKTAAEVNVERFDIQRSADGSTWQSIGGLPAINQPGVNTYAFTDKMALYGTNFYRVQQIDFDGKNSYTGVKSVKIESKETLQVYPNPATQYIVIQAGELTAADIRVFDMAGRNITDKLILQSLNESRATMLLYRLPPGKYFIRVGDQTVQFIKSR